MNAGKSGKKIVINIEPIGKRLVLDKPVIAIDAIRSAGIGIKSVCGGKGKCGKCRIIFMDGDRKPPTEQEKKILTADAIDHGVRLACQQLLKKDVKIYIPASSLSEEQKLQVSGEEKRISVDPPVSKYHIKLKAAALYDLDSDFKRIAAKLESEHHVAVGEIDLEALRLLPAVIRENSWDITVVVKDGEIISIEGGDTAGRSYGLAVDLGTTKIAILLVDLNDGSTVDSMGIMNPQISFGEDIMSRIKYAVEKPGNLKNLRGVVIESMGKAIRKLCSRNGIGVSDMLEMTIVGNTAMHHIFLGLPMEQLSLSPFVPVTDSPSSFKARDMGIELAPGAYIYMLPSIAGFVGSDHLAMVLATDIEDLKGNYLGVDIGTNTEIALSSKGSITSVSTASGPAFEGAHIKHGMRAAPGAIERVIIDDDTNIPRIQTINDKPPTGICGSGILDAIAEFLRTGVIDKSGKFKPDRPFICNDKKDGLQFLLARSASDGSTIKGRSELTCGEKDISVNQKDIVEIQLAKGAIKSGIDVLMDNAGIEPSSIDGIIIAGAFGSYIDPRNVVNIGMFPKVSLDKISQVGNAAGVGAKMVLISMEQRKKAEDIATRINYLELTLYPGFSDFFINNMQFPDPDEIIPV